MFSSNIGAISGSPDICCVSNTDFSYIEFFKTGMDYTFDLISLGGHTFFTKLSNHQKFCALAQQMSIIESNYEIVEDELSDFEFVMSDEELIEKIGKQRFDEIGEIIEDQNANREHYLSLLPKIFENISNLKD
jgi:hypothetical protein